MKIIEAFLSGELRDGLTEEARRDLVIQLETTNTAFVVVQIGKKQKDIFQGVVKPAVLAGKPCFVYTTDVK